MKYTELEIKVMDVLSKPNDNGEMIGINTGDYLCLYDFEIDGKVLRGVLSSLVKKGIIQLWSERVDDLEYGITDETIVELTEHGFHVLANKLYK